MNIERIREIANEEYLGDDKSLGMYLLWFASMRENKEEVKFLEHCRSFVFDWIDKITSHVTDSKISLN